eukprot:8724842-Ditylum_brightwellii.AAC.1
MAPYHNRGVKYARNHWGKECQLAAAVLHQNSLPSLLYYEIEYSHDYTAKSGPLGSLIPSDPHLVKSSAQQWNLQYFY